MYFLRSLVSFYFMVFICFYENSPQKVGAIYPLPIETIMMLMAPKASKYERLESTHDRIRIILDFFITSPRSSAVCTTIRYLPWSAELCYMLLIMYAGNFKIKMIFKEKMIR